MKRDDYVDSHAVIDAHLKIHAQLENWGRWCFNRSGCDSHPMFRWAKPAQHWDAIEAAVPVNKMDAQRIEEAIGNLPKDNAFAVRWAYVYQGPPMRAARSLAVNLAGLALLVTDSRQRLKNSLTHIMDV